MIGLVAIRAVTMPGAGFAGDASGQLVSDLDNAGERVCGEVAQYTFTELLDELLSGLLSACDGDGQMSVVCVRSQARSLGRSIVYMGGQGIPSPSAGQQSVPVHHLGQRGEDPPFFVLCQQTSLRDAEHILELRRDPQGRLSVVVFSSLDLLVEGCGEFQPWVAIPASRLETVVEEVGAEVILLDVLLGSEQRHTEDELVVTDGEES
jgi:hypothetical protein